MLEQKRLWGEGKTIERRVSLPPIVSAEGFTPETCRQEWRHGTQESVRHIARTVRKFSLKQFISIFTCGLLTSLFLRPADGSDLSVLAALNAVSGYEQQALDYVRTRVGGQQKIDNTGSLTATFGTGQPHTLLVAGLDEPGYLVSRIDQEGYLRVHRLADPAPHYDFDDFYVSYSMGAQRRFSGTFSIQRGEFFSGHLELFEKRSSALISVARGCPSSC